ncbi:ABC transporter ATP-binding protein [Lactobacillus mulieris]|uniref:ABC transporter ATP-binding protein n=1 Tax=Lactobacillus mulieris TaxID=2508708 RepID=A0AAW5X0H1_9LACO|nr:ABC transporter ATP-binding protein [Lactobacillus mulieris]MCZ3622880.1 ABC transporter ATP-binding protein [Lactobacillus mulieris]MCZ3624560.1 ABC transporter ATP-binding protein [Lactobacillus mulieris]MCZ3636885.1 ABC transporter ATP-binding protein [Lactobacillus mulieris]MCZ3690203.1 ABC transporter ATP-binding protein [Lactobacillus mulieris]MCZ3696846.1 ABC transporter ATP-binding protein [Lactobacillus mulieris]
MSLIEVKKCSKEYKTGKITILANNNITFSIEKGQLVVILGASGAGKSTLLNILGGMDTCTSGDVIVNGNKITNYSKNELTNYRRKDVGFVFQFYNLIPNLTAKENVELAAEIVPNAMEASEALEAVGLGERMNNFPAQLSGGEQQRVAIARAIAKNPAILLCDEPTGALDYQTGKNILRILQEMSTKKGSTVIIVTHNAAIASIANQVIHIHDGQVKKLEKNDHPANISEIEW